MCRQNLRSLKKFATDMYASKVNALYSFYTIDSDFNFTY